MPSPFPGMDPYLESPDLWPGVHNALAAEIQAILNGLMQPDYVAMLEAHLVYEVVEVSAVRRARPDISVLHSEPAGSGGLAMPAMAAAPAPVVSAVPLELPLELFSVEIRRSHVGTLVTMIEILSPTNKRPGEQALEDHRRKRRDLLRTQVHLLEIDVSFLGCP